MARKSKQLSIACTIATSALLAVAALLVVPGAALASATRYVSPFGTDAGDCSSAAAPCQTVQYTVDQSSGGDSLSLAAGAYVEQVVIAKNLTISGAGRDESVIAAPTGPLTVDSTNNNTYIVEIKGGVTVSMSNLTVAGPGPQGGGSDCSPGNPTSLDKGITVFGGSTLNLSHAAVRQIYDRPTSGCQRGDAISIGSACGSCAADVGHATLSSVVVSIYQKNGVAVRGTGSTLKVTNSKVTNNANSTIASNGIEVLNGAVGVISTTKVSGNLCNAPSCGPDPFSQTQASGILTIHAGAGTQVTGSTVTNNDMGVYTDDGIKVSHVNASSNRYIGIFVDGDAANGVFTFDTASTGSYGIITLSGLGNRFLNDTALGNSTLDMDAVMSGGDTNLYGGNHCGSASPSKAYWHCP